MNKRERQIFGVAVFSENHKNIMVRKIKTFKVTETLKVFLMQLKIAAPIGIGDLLSPVNFMSESESHYII